MKLRQDEQSRVDKEIDRCNQEITALEQEMLNNVSDQTTVEKSAHKTLQEVSVDLRGPSKTLSLRRDDLRGSCRLRPDRC
eukprot:241060-Prorocentrum_minimum.AAC.1